MKSTFSIIIFFIGFSLYSQSKPDFFPEDISNEGFGVRCFCKPGTRDKSRSKGLVISYNLLGNGVFDDEHGSINAPYSEYSSWERLKTSIKAPIINKDRLKALLGFKYESETFNLDVFGIDFTETFHALDQMHLKKSSLSLLLTHPINETKYLAMRLGYSANGNFAGLIDFDNRFAVYKALAIFGIKPNEDFEWGIGVNFSSSFRNMSVLPFLVYNRNFNKKWGIESVFPANFYVRYNLKPTTIVLAGLAYNSDSYRLDIELPTDNRLDYGMNHSEVMAVMRLEQQIVPWVWANAKLGYQANFSTDFESYSVSTTPFIVEPTNGAFFEIGIFVSPPDGMK